MRSKPTNRPPTVLYYKLNMEDMRKHHIEQSVASLPVYWRGAARERYRLRGTCLRETDLVYVTSPSTSLGCTWRGREAVGDVPPETGMYLSIRRV